MDIVNKALTDLLRTYWCYDDEWINILLIEPNSIDKERIAQVDDIFVHVYSNDHNPPHFHVYSKDGSIDVKYTIERCELIAGEIPAKYHKKILAWFQSPKSKLLLRTVWNKRY